jgi:protease-4
MTDEEKAYIQKFVMQTYDKFFNIVSTERKIAPDQLKPLADGRIISGKDAVQDKLINETGQIEDAYAKARELGGASGAAIVKYEAKFKFGRFFRMLGEAHPPKIELSLPQGLAPQLEPGRLYLLPDF